MTTTAFALSGGGNLGALQAGTVLALMEAGIRPDVLVGTSVGALNAAFLATRPGAGGAQGLMELWTTMRRREAFPFSPLTTLRGLLGVGDHLISPNHLRRAVRRWIPIHDIEEATVPLAVTATDALTGEAVCLTTGDLVESLVASSAIPGLFPPVSLDGRWLVDGSLSADLPVLQAQGLGADEVYVITTATAPRLRPPRGVAGVTMGAVSLVTARTSREQLALARLRAERAGGRVVVVPSPAPRAPGTFDFRHSGGLAQLAYARTSRWLVEERPVTKGRLPVEGGGAPDQGSPRPASDWVGGRSGRGGDEERQGKASKVSKVST